MDPLTDILTTLQMKGTLYFRTDFRAPWGVEVPQHNLVVRFHLVIRGSVWLNVDQKSPICLQRGDLALIPHGACHFLRDRPERETVPIHCVLDETAYHGAADLRYGGQGESTILVCGHFAFSDEVLHPILQALPPTMHIRATDGHDFTWLDAATRSIAMETAKRSPGWSAIVDRVSAILFIQALRTTLHTEHSAPMAAFADPQLGKALSSIHQESAHPWTLQELARRAGMSRTVFAERFKLRMGLSAMAYVTRWRLQKARKELVETDEIIAAIAEGVGYSSEAAFSRAFQRLYGAPPGLYRKGKHRAAQPS